MSSDFAEMLSAFVAERAEHLAVVGAHALAAHGYAPARVWAVPGIDS